MTRRTATRALVSRTRVVLLVLSLALCTALSVCFAVRPDRAMAVTIFPPLCWAVPGLGLACLGLGRTRVLAVLLWIAFLLAFGEPVSLLRGLHGPDPELEFAGDRLSGKGIRVITINADGNAEALAQVWPYAPDIVVVQEPPEAGRVWVAARRLFGVQAAFAEGRDCDILYRGRAPARPARALTAQARVRLASGEEIVVTGTHLAQTRPTLRLWRRDRWHQLAENRRLRREQMREVAGVVAAVPTGTPVLLAGDFNAPAGDAVFRLLRPRLRDAFPEAGRGWPNTWPREFPLVRIDQVWISREWRAVNVFVRPAGPTDHRMVVCDLVRVASAERG